MSILPKRPVIAIANQKGGVGKTTSAVSVSTELALAGLKTLLIDFDPQANATSGLGVARQPEGQDLYDVFLRKVPISTIEVPTQINGLSLIPSSPDLISLEVELGKAPGRELILRSELPKLQGRYDVILIDCPPSSGLLTLNAFGAASHLLIPLQAEYYALEGISALVNTIDFVGQTFNPKIEILGVFLTMYDSRNNLSSQVESEARKFFHNRMFSTKIPRNVKLSECPSHGLPIALYDPASAGARAYKELTIEIMDRLGLSVSEDRIAANQ